MEKPPRGFHDSRAQNPLQAHNNNNNLLLPSPTSNSSSSDNATCSIVSDGGFHNNNNNYCSNPSTPRTPSTPITRSEPNNPYPTTFVQADTSSFKQVVQMLTGSTETAKLASQSKPTTPRSPSSSSALDPNPNPTHTHLPNKNPIPPIRPVSKSKPSRLLERRNSLKSFRLSPLIPSSGSSGSPNHLISGLSPRNYHHHHHHYHHPEILSPSMLDFPALVLSPVTPLIPDPFNRSPPAPSWAPPDSRATAGSLIVDRSAEEKAIAEKGFYLHRSSPATTPRGSDPPRLLPLFPVTSPKVSGSAD